MFQNALLFNYGEFAIINFKPEGQNIQKLMVQDTEINITKVNDEAYICITDMLKAKDGDFFVTDWLRNRNTLEYIGTWESVYNPDFDFNAFSEITNRSGLNNFKISVKEFVERTGAISLTAKAGRYGGTYAHRDIAFEFARLRRDKRIRCTDAGYKRIVLLFLFSFRRLW